MRVFELAKELDYDKNKLISLCKEAGLTIKSPLSPLDADAEAEIRRIVQKAAQKVEPPKDNVIRSMKDLPSIRSDDLERGKVRIATTPRPATASVPNQAAPAQAPRVPRPATGTLAPGGRSHGRGPAQGQSQGGYGQRPPYPPREGGARDGQSRDHRPGFAPPPPMPPPAAGGASHHHANSNHSQPASDEDRFGRKRTALTEFERQQAKIQKKKKIKEKQVVREIKAEEAQARQEAQSKILRLGESVSVNELATNIGVPVTELIGKLFKMGIMAAMNQRLDEDTVAILAQEYGFTIEHEASEEIENLELQEQDAPEDLLPRDAVVTIMGHVDHGKTTLLDYIRKANVAKGESGGITQHIGAYKVATRSGHHICFLDTPGHEAFTAMRAHGSQITDVAVLVVAADDSVKPQTLEAINHAKNAGVPILVAITKIDKPGANLTKVYEDLGANGLLVEAWGGKVPVQAVSGLTGQGVDDLLDTIAIQAEVLELKANARKRGVGVVVEAGLHRGKGAVATVLVQQGTVKIGDIMVAGTAMGRVRALINEKGELLKEAGPSTPVEVSGFSEVPQFADKFLIVPDERVARSLIEKRSERLKRMKVSGAEKVVSLESLFAKVEEGKLEELKLIIKADVHGSVIALSESLSKITARNLRVNVVHSGVGPVSESDVMLASTASAIILCFHVRVEPRIDSLAQEHHVEIRNYKVIYEAIEDIEKALKGMLKPEYEEVVLGRAEIREVFSISKVGKVAGCFIEMGKVVRGREARIIRDGVEVFKGKIENLNRFKDQVTEVLSGYECGISLRFNDLKPKDTIECYEVQEIRR